MRERPRFGEGGEDLLAATLVDAARAYRRPPSSRARIARMLGIPIVVSVAAPVMAAASSIAAKMIVIVSAAAVLAGGGVAAYRIHSEHQAGRAASRRTAPVVVAAVRHAPMTSAPPALEPAMDPRDEQRAVAPDTRSRNAPTRLSFVHPKTQGRTAEPPVQATSRASETILPPAPARAAASVPVPAPAMKPAPLAPPISPQPFAPVAPVSAPATPIANGRLASAPRSVSVPAPTPAPQQGALAREIELLDAAERAERRGDHGAALVTLDEYARAFPDGAMLAESTVLRIAALLGHGDHTAAQNLARGFLARYGQSPLSAHVRSMLPELSKPEKELP